MNIRILLLPPRIYQSVQHYRKGFVGAGLLMVTGSFLFLFPYVGHVINEQYAHVTALHDVTGIPPHDPLSLVLFAVLIIGGTGLLIKGLY